MGTSSPSSASGRRLQLPTAVEEGDAEDHSDAGESDRERAEEPPNAEDNAEDRGRRLSEENLPENDSGAKDHELFDHIDRHDKSIEKGESEMDYEETLRDGKENEAPLITPKESKEARRRDDEQVREGNAVH